MDHKNSLSKTHTSTPYQTRTNTLSMHMAAGDEEDDGDASASEGDVEKVGGRRLVTGDGEDSYRRRTGKSTRLLVQTAPFTGEFQANESEPMIGETSTLIAHGKRGGLEMAKAAVSAPQ